MFDDTHEYKSRLDFAKKDFQMTGVAFTFPKAFLLDRDRLFRIDKIVKERLKESFEKNFL